MRNKPKIILFFLFATMLTGVSAQQVLSSAGASATGVGVQLSWTVGEPVIETFTGSSAILTQGFHQTRLTVTAVDVMPVPDLNLNVYPNPVSSVLKIQVTGNKMAPQMTYSLYNMEGKVILKKLFEVPDAEINMELFTSGTYLLKIFSNENQPIRTFKIIKE